MPPVIAKSKKAKKQKNPSFFSRCCCYSLAMPLYEDASGPQVAEKAIKVSWKGIDYGVGVLLRFFSFFSPSGQLVFVSRTFCRSNTLGKHPRIIPLLGRE